MGATPTCRGVMWPNDQALTRAVRSRRPDDNTFGVMQIQFWCGIRYMARQRSDNVQTLPDEARLVLESWRKAEPPASFAAACNASMIAWLNRCETADWVLDRGGPPIREDIIGRLNAA